MSDVASLTDAELRKELASMGYNSGAVTGTTRKLYEKKLLKMRAEHQKSAKPVGKVAAVKVAQATPPPVPKLTSTPKTTPPRERPIPRPAEPTPVSSAEESNSSWKHDRQVETSKSSFTTMRSNAFIVDTPTPPKPKPKAPTTYYKPSPRQPEPSPTPLSTIHGFDDSLDRLTDKAMRSSFTSIRSNAYQDRTPTPPRASAGLLAKYLPSSSKSFKNLGDTSGDDTDDDGHTESCRQIDPTPTRLKNIKYGQPTRQLTYFKINPPTPASMLDRFLRRKAKKPADSFNDRFRSMETKNQESTFSNLLERAMSVVVAAVIVAVLAYTITHTDPETVYATANTLRAIIVFLASFAYSYAIIPALFVIAVGAVAAACYYFYQNRENRKAKENVLFAELVDKITELIREADDLEGIAEPHVRDMIYPPSRRSEPEMKRWERAARFINEEDSRVRTDVRLLNGVECNVWVWVAKSRGF